jgi:hypothetical protein
MRLLVFLAVILTIGVFLYYYHPNENPIDWFAKQQPQAITADSTAQNQPAPQRGMPFADLAMAPDGTSPLQPQQNQIQPAQPNQPNRPAPGRPMAPANVQPAPQPPRAQVPKSLRDKFYKFAEENNVKITNFVENPVGQVLLTAQSNDKNNIFDFMDAVEKGIDMRDITNVPGGYSVKLDADGRTLVTSTMKIRYTPQY